MFNFIVIDDDCQIREMVECIIKTTFDISMQYNVYCYSSFSEYKSGKNIENEKTIFILDIELNDDYDGIEIATIIRRKNQKLHEIIFLTGFVDYAFNVLSYKINPIAFIKKDEKIKSLLKKVLMEAVDKISLAEEGRKITVKKGTTDIELKESDIIYAQKNKGAKSLNIVTELYSIDTIETIESFLSRLGDEFIKIDRSTILNYKNIGTIDVDKRNVTMKNSEIFYVNFKTIKRVMEFGNSHS